MANQAFWLVARGHHLTGWIVVTETEVTTQRRESTEWRRSRPRLGQLRDSGIWTGRLVPIRMVSGMYRKPWLASADPISDKFWNDHMVAA